MWSKSIPNITKIAQKSTQKWPFGPPRGDPGTQTDTGGLICTKLGPKGAQKWVIWGPWGTQKSMKIIKNMFKKTTRIRSPKTSAKVWKSDPPEPQKVGFRLRGASISTNPLNPQKVAQKSPKRLQNDSKRKPKGTKRPSMDPPKTHTKQRREKTPKRI